MKKLNEEQDKKLKAVKNKISKGWELTEFYWCGIPKWRFVKGGTISNYPRVNEDLVCDVLLDNGIKIFNP